MKKVSYLLVVSAFVIVCFSQLTSTKAIKSPASGHAAGDYEFPENIKAVIDKSCFGCHSQDGKSDEAKDALRWDLMGEYDKEKLISVLDEIIEVIEKQEMPPEKFLERKPEAKPTEAEYAALLEWAETEADRILE
jgi:mono/diheme cytochrome c family protein